jgi:hypothetical protein
VPVSSAFGRKTAVASTAMNERPFTEYEGMVLIESAAQAEEHIRQLKQLGKLHPTAWQYERGANHVHADMGQPDRVRVRQELQIAHDLEARLRQTVFATGWPVRSSWLSNLTRSDEQGETMTETAQPPQLSAVQVLGIAEADAIQAYRDLSPYQIRLALLSDGWHVDYELKDPAIKGGGPHYVIDPSSGAILRRTYEQ